MNLFKTTWVALLAVALTACGPGQLDSLEQGKPEPTSSASQALEKAVGPHYVPPTQAKDAAVACTLAGTFLSTALSEGQAALPFAQADYNTNMPYNPYNPYPQQDLLGTRNMIQVLQYNSGLSLTNCDSAVAAGTNARTALSDAYYAMNAETLIYNAWPANGPDWQDPANAYAHNNNAATNLQTAVGILNNCACTAPTPTMSASPNPVVVPYGTNTGTTTISWNAPYHSGVSITVSMDGAAATGFTGGGASGSQAASWIQPGHSYTFYLYDRNDASTVLQQVTVTGQAMPQPTITASPQTVQIIPPQTTGTTTLSWNAPGYSAVSVYVSVDGAAETLMSSTGSSGTASPNWITPGHRYTFALRPTGQTGTLLNSVTVYGTQPAAATLSASSNPVIIPYGKGTTNWTLTWNAPGQTEVDLYGQQNIQNPGQKLFLGSGPASGSTEAPMSVGEVATLWLYAHGDTTTPLATLDITGVEGAQPTLTASPNPVILPAGVESGSFTLSWNAPGYGQIDVWGEQNIDYPGQKLLLGTADETGSTQAPIKDGENATLWLYAHGDTTTPLAILNVSGHH